MRLPSHLLPKGYRTGEDDELAAGQDGSKRATIIRCCKAARNDLGEIEAPQIRFRLAERSIVHEHLYPMRFDLIDLDHGHPILVGRHVQRLGGLLATLCPRLTEAEFENGVQRDGTVPPDRELACSGVEETFIVAT
jgi:hypothetical protein